MEEQFTANSEVVIALSDSDEEQPSTGNILVGDRSRPTEAEPRTTDLMDLCVSPSTSTNCTPVAVSAGCQTIGTDNPNDLNSSSTSSSHECPICLQTCIHPARLPCGHIFCFLCVKGVAYKNRRCAMCRREIPPEFLDHPHLVNGIQDICKTKATEDGYQWFYEGRNGWWQYDDRTSQDIDEAYKKGEKSCTILVAGYVYIVDFEAMLQQRQNEPSRCRHVKRDLSTIPKKGVAGLRIEGNAVATDSNFVSQVYQSTLLGYDSIEEASRAAGVSADAHDHTLPLDFGTRPPTNASDFISTIAATDAAIRIASDIIGSTLAHADELTRSIGGRITTSTVVSPVMDSHHAVATGENGSNNLINSNITFPSWSALEVARGSRELLGAAEDLFDATQSVISEADQQTIDLFEQTLNDFHTLTLRNIVDSSEDDDDDNDNS